MSELDKCIRIKGGEAASEYAFGLQGPDMTFEQESDECFIFSFFYGDVKYVIVANGEVSEEDGIPIVTVNVSFNDHKGSIRHFAEAMSVITAQAYMSDRRADTVKVCIDCMQGDKRSGVYNVFSFSVANKKLEKIMQKLHRRLYLSRYLSEASVKSLKGLKFPYSHVREGQSDFIRRAYNTVKKGSGLFVEAPTGIGKTISAIYAAVRAIGDGYCDKVFYLTAKGSTANEAFKACERLFKAGAKVRCVQLSAKMGVCPRAKEIGYDCDRYGCARMNGYAARSEEAITELVNTRYGYSTDTIREVSEKYGICPYELSLDLSELCEVVICDYNYVFDPKVKIKRYFGDNARSGKFVFLIDEAHNLASRAKEMYSARITMSEVADAYAKISASAREEGFKDAFDPIKQELNSYAKVIHRISALCNDSLIKDNDGVKRGFYLSDSPMNGIDEATLKLRTKLFDFCNDFRETGAYDVAKELLDSLDDFYSLLEERMDGIRYYVEVEDDEVVIKCMCVDPAVPLERCFAYSYATVFFSATLTPMDYYVRTLYNGRRASILTLNSPFEKENRFCAVYTGVTTRYEKRDNGRTMKRMLSLVSAVLSAKKGNYILYFPSYGYMEALYKLFRERYPKIKSVMQKKDMTFSERRVFMDFFRDDTSEHRVGFCVLGGSFSEGIDLPGNRLIGTIIFGVGLPGISNEQNIIREYYDNAGDDGYDFAYTYPGFNNVLQAAGRVIRSENDRGVIVFADERYADEKYKRMMPKLYRGISHYSDLHELSDEIATFWLKN